VVLDIQRKNRGQTQVKIKRMATSLIAPKLKLFDLFTQTKEAAMQMKDQKMHALVEACISTWTDMTIADGEREDKIKSNCAQVRCGCVECGKELETNLKEMKGLTADLMASFDTMRKGEAMLKADLEEARRKLLGMQDLEAKVYDATSRVNDLELALRKSQTLNSSLEKEIGESQAREVKVKGALTICTNQVKETRDTILQLERKLAQATKQIPKLSADIERKDVEIADNVVAYKKLDADWRAAQVIMQIALVLS